MDVIKAAVQLGLKAHSTIALSAEESSHTYLQLLQSALSISSELKTILSAQKAHAPKQRSPSNGRTKSCAGPRVGIIAKPSVEFVVGMWATWLCRGVAVPLALSYPESELLHVLTDAQVSVVFGTRDHEALLEEASRKVSSHFFLLPRMKSLEEMSGVKPSDSDSQQVLDQIISLSTIEGSTPGLIIYTSGTTGKPKGVVHSHSGMNAQVKMLSEAWEYTSDDCFLHCLPLHHVHGLFNGLFAPLYAGAMVKEQSCVFDHACQVLYCDFNFEGQLNGPWAST